MSSVLTPRNKFTRDVFKLPRLPEYQQTRKVYVKRLVSGSTTAFDPGYSSYKPQYLISTRATTYIRRGARGSVNSATVFQTSTILPYKLKGDIRDYSAELEFLARQVSRTMPRVPCLYRISDSWVIDDLGRLYCSTKSGYRWYRYRLSGDLRNNITLTNADGTKLTRPAYVFSGLAGYNPHIQYHFAFSLKYDFHHVQENKLDLRPDSIVPLETDLHRYVHSKDMNDSISRFFKLSKKF